MVFAVAVTLSAAALLAFIAEPALGIMLLFIAKPIVDANWGQVLFLGMPLTQIVAGLVPLLMLWHMAIAKPEASISRMPLKWIWIAHATYLSTVVLLTIGQEEAMLGVNLMFRTMNGLVGFYMVQAFFHDERRIRQFLIALLVAGLFPISVGIYQVATGVVWRVEFQEVEGLLRNVGMYHDVIMVRHYAFQTMLALLLLAASSPHRSLLFKTLGLIYFAAATLVMVKAYSKAGIVIFGVWGLCWTILQKRVWTLICLVGMGTLIALYAASDLAGNVLTIFQKEVGFLGGQVEADRTLNGRWYLWQDMLTQWSHLPWTGSMFGSGKIGLGAHNDYLQVLFHGGLVGLALYLTLLISIGARIAVNLWKRVDPLAVAALMVFLSWIVDTVGLVPSAYSGYQWFVWGVIGLSLRVRQQERFGSLPANATEPSAAVSLPAIALPELAASRRFPLVSG